MRPKLNSKSIPADMEVGYPAALCIEQSDNQDIFFFSVCS